MLCFKGVFQSVQWLVLKRKEVERKQLWEKEGRVCFFCWLCNPFSEHSQDMAKEFFMLWI